jgi:hypothetical protein
VLPERAEHHLGGEIGRLVARVQNGVYFRDVHREHFARIMQEFHREVALTVGSAAAYAGSYAGGVAGIHAVYVEGEMESGGAVAGDADRFLDHAAHSHLVDVAHGESADALFADRVALSRIEVTDADQHGARGIDHRIFIAEFEELFVAAAEHVGEGHPVDVAGIRSFGRVDVAVSVEPDNAHFLFFLAVEFRYARDGAHRERVISAEGERNAAGFERFVNAVAQFFGCGHDLGKVFDLRVAAAGDRFAYRHLNVAYVVDVVAELLEARAHVSDSDRGRTHVYSAAAGAEIRGETDDANFFVFEHARTIEQILGKTKGGGADKCLKSVV